jgi:hypothetical protein
MTPKKTLKWFQQMEITEAILKSRNADVLPLTLPCQSVHA